MNKKRVSRALLAQVAWHGLFLQGALQPERRQGLGFAAALSPLARLWPSGKARRAFFKRHLDSVNTNPSLAGPLLGAVARLEEAAAGGDTTALERIPKLKRGAEAPFAAMGDGLFWRGLRPAAGIWGSGLALAWGAVGPVVFLAAFNLLHLGFHWGGVFWGYRKGQDVVILLRHPFLGRLSRFLVAASFWGILAVWGPAVVSSQGWGLGLLAWIALGAGILVGRRGFLHGSGLVVGGIILGLLVTLLNLGGRA